MSDLALDPQTGDLLIEGGDAVVIRGAEAIAQDWRTRMTLFRGEWKLDRRVGIDYQRLFLDKRPSNALLRHVFETVTRQTAGVASIERLEFSFDRASRALTVRAEVTAVSGEPISLHRNVLFDLEPGVAA